MENLPFEIEKWFKDNEFNQNKWNNNKIGRLLKSHLTNCGNWKNKPRGNPRKGKEISDRVKKEKSAW